MSNVEQIIAALNANLDKFGQTRAKGAAYSKMGLPLSKSYWYFGPLYINDNRAVSSQSAPA